MCKRPVLESLVLVGVMGLAIGFYTLSCFAQGGETITITTYYPSPYGNYKELEMHEGAIFVPHNSAGDYVEDLECNADKEGKLVYGKKDSSVTEDTWYYCDGSEWKEMEMGGCKWNGVDLTFTGCVTGASIEFSSSHYYESEGDYRFFRPQVNGKHIINDDRSGFAFCEELGLHYRFIDDTESCLSWPPILYRSGLKIWDDTDIGWTGYCIKYIRCWK